MLTPTVALLVGLLQGSAVPPPTPVAELLQRYARGEAVEGLLSPHFQTTGTFGAFVRDLEREARKVPAPLVATFALDAAAVAYGQVPTEPTMRQKDVLSLLEVGCAALRKANRNPSRLEVHWQLLATALATSSTRSNNGSAETFHAVTPFLPAYDDHFKHMLERNRADPHIAIAVARYDHARFYVWRVTWGVAVVPKGVLTSEHWRERDRRIDTRLENLLSALAPLIQHADLGDEARVRSGDVLLHLGRDEEAFELFGDAPLKDEKWNYIRRLLRARTFVQQGKALDAAREYEAATLINPRARPANLAFAGLAYIAGRHEISQQLLKAASEANAPDPWVAYMYPGAQDWNTRMAALRKEARGD